MGHAFPSRLVCTVLVGLALAGCGRRGPLELPPGAPQTQSPAAAEAQQTRVLNEPDMPGLIQNPNRVYDTAPEEKERQLAQHAASPVGPHPINAPPAPKRNTFLLDPLL